MCKNVAVKFESRNFASGGLSEERNLELCTLQHRLNFKGHIVIAHFTILQTVPLETFCCTRIKVLYFQQGGDIYPLALCLIDDKNSKKNIHGMHFGTI